MYFCVDLNANVSFLFYAEREKNAAEREGGGEGGDKKERILQ